MRVTYVCISAEVFCFVCLLAHSFKNPCAIKRIWDLDAFFTDELCWTALRFHKGQLPQLLRLLQFDRGGDPDGLWRFRDQSGHVQYKYQPMELLCIFLVRLASGETNWEKLTFLFGGRGRSAISDGFYLALDHIHTKFAHTVSDFPGTQLRLQSGQLQYGTKVSMCKHLVLL